jgi:hypothetical protein
MLKRLADKEVGFIDENSKLVEGILLEIPALPSMEAEWDYFLIPFSQNLLPFKIPYYGDKRVSVLRKKDIIKGNSNLYADTATQEQLKLLVQREGMINSANPLREIQGGRESLVERYLTNQKKTCPKLNNVFGFDNYSLNERF